MRRLKPIHLHTARAVLNELMSVDPDGRLVTKLYIPYIVPHAMSQVSGVGLAEMLLQAVDSFVEDGCPTGFEVVLKRHLPDYIRALVDDAEVQSEAIVHVANRLGLPV